MNMLKRHRRLIAATLIAFSSSSLDLYAAGLPEVKTRFITLCREALAKMGLNNKPQSERRTYDLTLSGYSAEDRKELAVINQEIAKHEKSKDPFYWPNRWLHSNDEMREKQGVAELSALAL